MGPPRARHARRHGAAARGYGRVRSRRQVAPPLPSAARRGRRAASGRRASRPINPGLQPGSNKGLTGKGAGWDRTAPPRTLPLGMDRKAARKAYQGGPKGWEAGLTCPRGYRAVSGLPWASMGGPWMGRAIAPKPTRRDHPLQLGQVKAAHRRKGLGSRAVPEVLGRAI